MKRLSSSPRVILLLAFFLPLLMLMGVYALQGIRSKHASVCSLTQLCLLLCATLLPYYEKAQASMLVDERVQVKELSHLS